MARTETINWHLTGYTEPDEGIMVLLHAPDAPEPVWPGYLDSGEWHWVDGTRVGFDVIEWADMPAGSSVDDQDGASDEVQCACKSIDARGCYMMRYPNCRDHDEVCECACHYECDAEEFDL